jgi:hypothetical protein
MVGARAVDITVEAPGREPAGLCAVAGVTAAAGVLGISAIAGVIAGVAVLRVAESVQCLALGRQDLVLILGTAGIDRPADRREHGLQIKLVGPLQPSPAVSTPRLPGTRLAAPGSCPGPGALRGDFLATSS